MNTANIIPVVRLVDIGGLSFDIIAGIKAMLKIKLPTAKT
jgi:hypothetical protein